MKNQREKRISTGGKEQQKMLHTAYEESACGKNKRRGQRTNMLHKACSTQGSRENPRGEGQYHEIGNRSDKGRCSIELTQQEKTPSINYLLQLATFQVILDKKYRLGHPECYLYSLSSQKKGSKYQRKKISILEKEAPFATFEPLQASTNKQKPWQIGLM